MTLGELIRAHRGETSYERLARRAGEAGHDISGTMIHTLATAPLKNIPRVDTIHALSAALLVSPKEILDAAAESVGLVAAAPDSESHNVTNRTQVAALLAVVRHRPPDEIEQLSRVVRTVAEALDARAPQGSPETADHV